MEVMGLSLIETKRVGVKRKGEIFIVCTSLSRKRDAGREVSGFFFDKLPRHFLNFRIETLVFDLYLNVVKRHPVDSPIV